MKKIVLIVLGVLAVSQAYAEQVLIVTKVDGYILGDLQVEINAAEQAQWVNGPQLIKLISPYVVVDKIERLKTMIEANESLTLQNIERVGITPVFNQKELTINFNIPVEMRIEKDISVIYGKRSIGLSLGSDSFSGYLNLFGLVGYTLDSDPFIYDSRKDPVTGRAELVQNLWIATLESTANYTEFDTHPIRRVDSSLVHDFVDDRIRLRVGDFNSYTQGFQSALAAGGISVHKEFSIRSGNSMSKTERSTIIQVKTNSVMEVYVNGNLISKNRVQPGPYNLKQLPLLYGQNKVKVVLQDDFGKKEEFVVDMLFDDQILAEGVHDFSYQVGRPSYFDALGEKQYYPDNFSSFYHKYGVTNDVTLFLNHQNYLSSNLYGVGAGHLSKFGTNFLDVAAYSDNSVSSSSAVRWRYNSPDMDFEYFSHFRLLAGAEQRSSGFHSITALLPSLANFSAKYDFIFQKQLTEKSSMSLGVTQIKGQNGGTDDLSRQLNYQTSFAKNWRFDLNYNWSDQQPTTDRVLLTLTWLESEGKAHASLAHNTAENYTAVNINKNSRFESNDFQLNMQADRKRDIASNTESQGSNISLNFYGKSFETRTQLSNRSSATTYNSSTQFGLGTALAWTTDSLTVSRPITDSFAVVEPEGIERGQSLSIPNGNNRDRLTLRNNENYVFPNLSAYNETELVMDSTGLGTSSHLDRESYILRPTYRSGVFIPLKVIKTIIVRGKLAFPDAEQVSFNYGRILTEDGKVYSENFFTDESGRFLIEGLTYGKYQIELKDPRFNPIVFELIKRAESTSEDDSDAPVDPEASEYEMGTINLVKKAGT